MNRRTKIIVSVAGIFIVALALIGLTYAYFLTRINGNSNAKSISVTTDKLELTYGDGSTNILTTSTPIQPSGSAIGTKDFTVTNNGSDTEYVVFIEDVNIKDAITNSNTTFLSNDFKYELTCTSTIGECNSTTKQEVFPINGGILLGTKIKKGAVHSYTFKFYYTETGIDQSDDMNKTINAKINIEDIRRVNPYKSGTLAYNIINNAANKQSNIRLSVEPYSKVAEEAILTKAPNGIVGETITIPLSSDLDNTLYYSESKDYMNFSKCAYESQCTDVTPYVEGTTTCSDIKGKYIYIDGPDYTSTQITYIDDCKDNTLIINPVYESQLSVTTDDLGTSYYYRGAVENNYVTFANMCWRIVRINGDGSTKLILEDQGQPCGADINGNWAIPTTTGGSTYTGNYGYNYTNVTNSSGQVSSSKKYIMNYLESVTNADKSMAKAFYDFQTNKLGSYLSKLKSGDWCIADTAYTASNGSSGGLVYESLLSDVNDLKYNGTSVYYDSYVRLSGDNEDNSYNPTLNCTGTKMSNFKSVVYNGTEIIKEVPMYVSAITADEAAYAGAGYNDYNKNYYLINEEFKKGSSGANKSYAFWSLSPVNFGGDRDYAFYVDCDGFLNNNGVGSRLAFRPAVSIASGAEIASGDGTIGNPYIIG